VKAVDLRSDTVTLPSPAMREAMYRAEVGDDGRREDPTVHRLEEMAAERLGKEAALFVASGIMANLMSLITHCRRGDQVIVGDLSHIYLDEQGGSAIVGGLHLRSLANQPDGGIGLHALEAAIKEDNVHCARTRLLCLENTHNYCGGVALSPGQTNQMSAIAERHNMSIHLDGARIFNAAVALGVEVKELTGSVDSVMFCLSKGLAAPVGSIICGSRDFIEEARRNRRMLGGQMRQSGILAAAGIVALDEMIDRLDDDHRSARRLAEGLDDINGMTVDLERVQTNIVIFRLTNPKVSPAEFIMRSEKQGVKLDWVGGNRFRAVTHYGIEREDIEKALEGLRHLMQEP
jgi:threonine aldolase